MADLNLRKIDDALMSKLKQAAAYRNVTLKDFCVAVLRGVVNAESGLAAPAGANLANKPPRAATKAPPHARALAALPSPTRGLVKPAAALPKRDGCPMHGKGCGFSKGAGLWYCSAEGRAVAV